MVITVENYCTMIKKSYPGTFECDSRWPKFREVFLRDWSIGEHTVLINAQQCVPTSLWYLFGDVQESSTVIQYLAQYTICGTLSPMWERPIAFWWSLDQKKGALCSTKLVRLSFTIFKIVLNTSTIFLWAFKISIIMQYGMLINLSASIVNRFAAKYVEQSLHLFENEYDWLSLADTSRVMDGSLKRLSLPALKIREMSYWKRRQLMSYFQFSGDWQLFNRIVKSLTHNLQFKCDSKTNLEWTGLAP